MGQTLKHVKSMILVVFLCCLVFLLFGSVRFAFDFGLVHGSESIPIFLESEDFEAKDLVLYFGTTDNDITVSWDHNEPLPDRYEVRLYHVEREEEGPAGIGGGPGNELTFFLPRTGHFEAWVRACIDTIDEGQDLPPECPALPCCSPWSKSIDPTVATVNGEARGWWIYGFVAPPGPIIINEGP